MKKTAAALFATSVAAPFYASERWSNSQRSTRLE